MRLDLQKSEFLKNRILEVDPEAEVYLFGSRTDANQKGGDIDVLILSEHHLPRNVLRKIKIGFYAEFGYQNLDLVNFTFDEEAPFKKLALLDAIRL